MVPRGHTGTRWPIGRPCTVEAPCHEVGANNGGDNRAYTKSFQSVELIECLHWRVYRLHAHQLAQFL